MKKIILIIFIFILDNCLSKDIEGLTYSKGINEKEKIIWLLSSLNGKNFTDTQPSLDISDGKASIFGGCNTGSGKVNISGNKMKFESMMVTEKACLSNGNAILLSEAEYFQALNKIESYTLAGETLILSGSSMKLEFSKRPKVEPKDLQITVWQLNTIVDSGMARSLFVNSRISIIIKDNKIFGNFGCGNFEGIVIFDKNNFHVSEIKENISDCKNPEINYQAKDFLKHLTRMDVYTVEENHLTVKNREGKTWLVFIAD
jgi:heat shock protein HslJ